MKILLDTNAYTALFRGHADVARRIRASEEVLLSTIVVGELLFGFRNGSRFETNRQELIQLLANPFVSLLPVALVTADRFGRIAASLKRKGRPLPTNDIWIAAIAFQYGYKLFSKDRHFDLIPGLVLLNRR